MRLRSLKNEDASFMLEWMQDKTITKNLIHDFSKATLNDAILFIKNANLYREENRHYAIVDERDIYLGTTSLKRIDKMNRIAELAICLRASQQGKGLGLLAIEKLLGIAFEEMNLEKIYLSVLENNIPAIKLYEKVGFVYEGKFREHFIVDGKRISLKWYSLLKREFKRKE